MDTVNEYAQKWVGLSQPEKISKFKIVAAACYAFFLFLFVIFVFGGTRTAERSPTNVVLFLEPTPDALASIRYLALRADIAIQMIVVGSSSWALDAFQSVEAINGFVSMLKNEGSLSYAIPVHYGSSLSSKDCPFSKEINYEKEYTSSSSTPIACTYSRAVSPKEHFQVQRLFGVSEALLAQGEGISFPTYYASELQQLLTTTAVHFLVFGPATDAALFLQQSNSSLMESVTSIMLAGGAFAANGNADALETTNKVAEINFFFDPLASSYIVSGKHGRPVTLVPLDAAFKWSSSAYNLLIQAQSFRFPSETTSTTVAASALSSFYKFFPHLGVNVSVNYIAAVYFSDAVVQSSSSVSIFSVAVDQNDDLEIAGKSVYYLQSKFTSTVLLEVQEETFWQRVYRVDALSSS